MKWYSGFVDCAYSVVEGQPTYVPLHCQGLRGFCLSLPFAVFPAALAPGMPGTPAPGKKQGKQLTGTQQFGFGYYGPIKHVDVHASQLLDPRVVSRRMICGATCAAAASFGWSSPLAAFGRRVVKKHTKGFGGHKLVAALVRILGFWAALI